jgi:hypothetical protein
VASGAVVEGFFTLEGPCGGDVGTRAIATTASAADVKRTLELLPCVDLATVAREEGARGGAAWSVTFEHYDAAARALTAAAGGVGALAQRGSPNALLPPATAVTAAELQAATDPVRGAVEFAFAPHSGRAQRRLHAAAAVLPALTECGLPGFRALGALDMKEACEAYDDRHA